MLGFCTTFLLAVAVFSECGALPYRSEFSMRSLRPILSACLALFAAFAMVACDSPAPGDAATVPDESGTSESGSGDDASVGSYARGLITGRRSASPTLDVEAFVEGLRDGLNDAEQKYSDEEMQTALNSLMALENEASNNMAEANLAAGREFMATNSQRDGVTETGSGLQYEVLVAADGPRPTETSVVRVHYRGTTLDGETFDASYDRGEPAEFPLNRVIQGWTEGLQLMSVGSKYMFWIPADIGYGMQAPPGAPFGPGSTLVFEVELLEIIS
jgi:FKBP-type peptidyl-prolyl cis-trans isomerase